MRVVITGAAGRIGTQIVEELSGIHEICLIDRIPIPDRKSVVADLAKVYAGSMWRPWSRFTSASWTESFEGAKVVLHLAADVRNDASWDSVRHNNIQATWNVIKAAAKYQVSRVIFASSNWTVKALEHALAPGCYEPGGSKIGSDVSPCPLRPYGVSKAFGELIGRMFVEEEKLRSFIAVRIGYYDPQPPLNNEDRRLWIGTQDLRTLLRRCVEVETQGFHVAYGVSAQPIVPYDLSYTSCLLSWMPQETL